MMSYEKMSCRKISCESNRTFTYSNSDIVLAASSHAYSRPVFGISSGRLWKQSKDLLRKTGHMRVHKLRIRGARYSIALVASYLRKGGV
jgi:hypothetical protein